MKFSKVKLVNGGLHGVEASYTELEVKDSFQFFNEVVKKRKAPAHRALVDQVELLRLHLMNICLIHEDSIEDVDVRGVSSDGDSQFIISGVVRTLGNSFFALNTPLVKDGSGYEHFDYVLDIVRNIYREANIYFSKRDVELSKQIAIDFVERDVRIGNVPQFSLAEVEAMEDGDDNLKKLMIQALERKGCIVMSQDDHEVNGEDNVHHISKGKKVEDVVVVDDEDIETFG